MKITSSQDGCRLELRRCRGEYTPAGARDVALHVEFSSPQGFNAKAAEVWFERDSTIMPFIEDLRAFEAGSQRWATLTDLPCPGRTPGADFSEFRLNILRIEEKVFIRIDLASAPGDYFRPELGSFRSSIYFECAQSVAGLIQEFERLFALSQ